MGVMFAQVFLVPKIMELSLFRWEGPGSCIFPDFPVPHGNVGTKPQGFPELPIPILHGEELLNRVPFPSGGDMGHSRGRRCSRGSGTGRVPVFWDLKESRPGPWSCTSPGIPVPLGPPSAEPSPQVALRHFGASRCVAVTSFGDLVR